MPALPLKQLAIRACVRNVKSIHDIGGMTYDLAKPFLVKVDNPHQLRKLELSEPAICGEDAELWQALIERDAPGWAQHRKGPSDPKNWHKVYRKAVQEDQNRVQEHSAILQAAMDKQVAQKNEHQTTLLQNTVAPKAAKRSYSSAFSREPTNPGSRTKLVGGRSLLERARREAREAKMMSKRNVEASTNGVQSALQRQPSRTGTLNPRPAAPTGRPIGTSSTSQAIRRPNGPLDNRNAAASSSRGGLRRTPPHSPASRAADLPQASSAAFAGHSLPSPAAQRANNRPGVVQSTPTRRPGAPVGTRMPANIFATPPRKRP